MMKTVKIREHEPLKGKLSDSDIDDLLRKFITDKGDNTPRLFAHTQEGITACNYIGIVPINDCAIEIYPKISLEGVAQTDADDISDSEKEIVYSMLWHYGGLEPKRYEDANIEKLKGYTLWEIYIHIFLQHVYELVRRGVISHYEPYTENLPYLKGRLAFPQHAIINSANKARFYSHYDDYTPNNAANRLIRKTLDIVRCRELEDEQLRRKLITHFGDIPASEHISRDNRQYIRQGKSRTMRHYNDVMHWVNLLLLRYGLITYQGDTGAPSLLFPMQKVFEDFVTHHIQIAFNDQYDIKTQGPKEHMLKENLFEMKPDIYLKLNGGDGKYIIDAKWKEINGGNSADNYGIDQADIYQLFGYGKLYGCDKVILLYPQNSTFKQAKTFCFNEGNAGRQLNLVCFPFNLQNPQASVNQLRELL